MSLCCKQPERSSERGRRRASPSPCHPPPASSIPTATRKLLLPTQPKSWSHPCQGCTQPILPPRCGTSLFISSEPSSCNFPKQPFHHKAGPAHLERDAHLEGDTCLQQVLVEQEQPYPQAARGQSHPPAQSAQLHKGSTAPRKEIFADLQQARCRYTPPRVVINGVG